MITPLMLILSSINEEFQYDKPLDISYLSDHDRTIVSQEALRMCNIILANPEEVEEGQPCIYLDMDESGENIYKDEFGRVHCSTVQIINGEVRDISVATAALLTRIREAAEVYKKKVVVYSESDVSDLSSDDLILGIQNNPNNAYIYIVNTMAKPGESYLSKVSKIADLYNSIRRHSEPVSTNSVSYAPPRLRLHSSFQFWQTMLMQDLIRRYARGDSKPVMAQVSISDFSTIQRELQELGFYGFTNPETCYNVFSSARLQKKSNVNIDPSVMAYLEKIAQLKEVL